MWEHEVRLNTAEMADSYREQLAELENHYGMRLPSVRDHINERFVKPLAVNRMVSLVPLAVDDARRDGESEAFGILRHEIDCYREDTVGSGIDVPPWLRSLEKELNRIDTEMHMPNYPEELEFNLRPARMNLTEMRRALRDIGKPLGESGSGPQKPKGRGRDRAKN